MGSNSHFEVHDVEWTPDRVARFWSFTAATPGIEQNYFSAALGAGVVQVASAYVALSGSRVLDFGCGLGAMMRELARHGARCEGLEFSQKSANEATRRLAGTPGFTGVTVASGIPTPLEAGSYDAVFLIEVIEHLLEGQLQETLRELHRLLRPGGRVVITTPNDEELQALRVQCPECGCTFHRWQHVRRFDAQSLSAELAEAGFTAVVSIPIDFAREERRSRGLFAKARDLYSVVRGRVGPRPNLLYVGERRSSGT